MAGRKYRSRFALYLVGLVLLVDVCLLVVGRLSARYYVRSQVRQRLMAAASTGALLVEGESLTRIQTAADEHTRAYRDLQHHLRALRAGTPGVRYVYVLRPGPDPAHWHFVADAEENAKLASHPGDAYATRNSPEIWQGLQGPAADREPASDPRGTWLSGYAPIRDRAGRTVALLGVDMSAALVASQEAAPVRAMLVASALLLLLTGLLAAWLGTRLWHRERRLLEEGSTDFLTSLPNHRHFQERLDAEWARAQRQGHPLALVMLDVDHFRRVNSSHGHQGGDDLLRELAFLMREYVRPQDLVARYGGEEFALLLPETTPAQAWASAERLRTRVAGHAFEVRSLGRPTEISVTLSAGVAAFPAEASTRDELVVAADAALLRAKTLSRNRVCRTLEEGAPLLARWDSRALGHAVERASGAAAQSLAYALGSRDAATQGHAEHATCIALALADAMGLSTETQMTLRVAGLLHDIGTVGVPAETLGKDTPLAPEEWEQIRAHPLLGAELLEKVPRLVNVIPIVRHHHERYDGTGYPGGLTGDEIPLGARIMAVADAYDAMTSDRPYRKALTQEEAVAELRAHAGTQFDATVVGVFLHLLCEEELPAATSSPVLRA